ncbi:MAG: metalloregulator ArsR/SmtB family transcription factor [Chloroflexota bacterium]
MAEPNPTPALTWEYGTAFELFVSLQVLHDPDHYGVRASWAAGIRSRIPAPERKLLEEVLPFIWIPLCGIRSLNLPSPKDAISVMWALKQLPAEQRIPKLLSLDSEDDPVAKTLLGITEKRAWDEADFEVLAGKLEHAGKEKLGEESLKKFLDWLAKPEEFGEAFLSALQAYHQAFFAEEEKRIQPVLKEAVSRGQQLAETLPFNELVIELSQGVRIDDSKPVNEVILIPAYWTTPLVIFDRIGEARMMFMFGARPANMPAIPGEKVPDGLVRALKAVADPTRLKILSYLAKEELTPSELARRLHLRAPTVTHHLNELRLAGLVNLSVQGNEKLYAARREALRATFQILEDFLDS